MTGPEVAVEPAERADRAPRTATVRLASLHRYDALLVAATTLLMSVPAWFWKFGRDQGIYAYTAWAWLHGEAPYRDVYVFKPPGTVFFHAASQLLFGANMAAIRLLDAGLQAATAVMLAWLVATWSRDRAVGLWAGLLFAPTYYAYGHWHTSQTDGWFNPLVVAALLLVSRAPAGRPLLWASGLAGLAVGGAVVLKYTALALGLPLVVAIGLARRDHAPRARWQAAAVACAAIPLPLLATFAWLAATGSFEGYLESQRLVLGYAAHTMPDHGFSGWMRRFGQPELRMGWTLLGSGVLFALARRRLPGGAAVWAAWLLAAAASLFSQGRGFEYHILPLVPVLVWAGATLAGPLARRLDGWRRGPSVVLFLAAVFTTFPPPAWKTTGERLVRAGAIWAGAAEAPAGNRFERVARVIREHTDPDDTVYVWTYDPVIMFLAERKQVSRFLYNFPMVVKWQDGTARRELMEALRAEPPELFVVGRGDAAKHVTGNRQDSKKSFESFAELRDWVHANYAPLTEQDGFQLFVRRRTPE